MEEFGKTVFEISKEDISKEPKRPVLRMYDDETLIGKFDIKTQEILFDDDLADYDKRFALEYLTRNKKNLLETWSDYVGGFAHAKS